MLVLLVLLVAVLATGMLATYNLYRSAEDRYIGVVLPLRGLTRDVLFQMKREESGVRGYMITTDRRSLVPYKAGRKMVLADLNQIAALTRGRSVLGVRLREVRREAVALHGFYDRLIVFVADGKEGQQIARHDVLEGASCLRLASTGLHRSCRPASTASCRRTRASSGRRSTARSRC